ncbi:MAG: class I SAM-dependent methyltransferase [Chthoniobacterales bacterium]
MDTEMLTKFKQAQREGWSNFVPVETFTTPSAARLVSFAGIRSGQTVLDVGCGTGVVAVTAAQRGAKVSGADLTPELLERARENSQIAEVEIDLREADVEALPFANDQFDVVLSQFGHMFAPRPDVAIAEMLRVLKPGGTIAFATWPPELLVGSSFSLVGKYMPPPPPGVSPPPQWGDISIVQERLGTRVKDIQFDRDRMFVPALSLKHYIAFLERTVGPMIKLVQSLGPTDPVRLAEFRREYEELLRPYFDNNLLRQDYLLTRATKV